MAATYDDLRRAPLDRAAQARRVLDSYVIPWFGPQTSTVGDVNYYMVHDWLLTLVGRRRGEPDDHQPRIAGAEVSMPGREISLRETAEMSEVSLVTTRRRWREGELCGAYRDSPGHIRVPEGFDPRTATVETRAAERAFAAGRRRRPVGPSPGAHICLGQWAGATGFDPRRD